MKAAELESMGLESTKPYVSIGGETPVELEDFFCSLQSEKTEACESLELSWQSNGYNERIAMFASVRIVIESMTQVYTVWYDPGPTESNPGVRHVWEKGNWEFAGRILDRSEGFDISPDAGWTRVRGFIDLSAFAPSLEEVRLAPEQTVAVPRQPTTE